MRILELPEHVSVIANRNGAREQKFVESHFQEMLGKVFFSIGGNFP